MENLLIALNAVLPFFFYLILGNILRRFFFKDDLFWQNINSFVFKAFYAFMMFNNIYNMSYDQKINSLFLIMIVAPLSSLIILLLITIPKIEKRKDRQGVLIQAIFRSNALIFALPLSQSVFDKEGASVATFMVLLTVPLYNIVSVTILEYFANGSSSLPSLILKVLKNPIIDGAIVGFIIKLFHIHFPRGIASPISDLAACVTPLSVITLGATQHITAIRKNLRIITATLLIKMIILPAIILGITFHLPLSSIEKFVLFTMYATPVAVASYPMVQNIGGDSELAGQLVTISTIASVFTLFIWIFFMGHIGML